MHVCQLVILNMSKIKHLIWKGRYLRRNGKKGMFFEVNSDRCLIMTRGCCKSLQYKRHYETHWSLRTKKVNELGVRNIYNLSSTNILIVLMMCEVTICSSAKNKNTY